MSRLAAQPQPVHSPHGEPVDWAEIIKLPIRWHGVVMPLRECMLSPGTRIIRQWQHRLIVVDVIKAPPRRVMVRLEGNVRAAKIAERDGRWRYVYNGQRWRSLTMIATHLQGRGRYPRYGAAFFGLVDDHRARHLL